MPAITLSEKVAFFERVFGAGDLARDGRNFSVVCPICVESKSGTGFDQSKRKLAIFVENEWCHCWVCGYKSGSLANLIAKYGTSDQLTHYRSHFRPDLPQAVLRPDGEKPEEKLALPADFRMLVDAPEWDPDAMAIKNYALKKRGLKERDLWYFKLGMSNTWPWRMRVIMPSFDVLGKLNFIVARHIDDTVRPKYVNPLVPKNEIIFNELNIDWDQDLVLCEGPFDLAKCPDNTVPLLGSDLHSESYLFNRIIAHRPHVFLALDGNMRDTKTPKIARLLEAYNVTVSIVPVPDDPGVMTKATFKQALQLATPYTWQDDFRSRLEMATRVRL